MAALSLPYFLLLSPLTDDMLAVKTELCGGTLTFAVGMNNQVVAHSPTNGPGFDVNQTYVQAATMYYAFPTDSSEKLVTPLKFPHISSLRNWMPMRYDEWLYDYDQCHRHGKLGVDFSLFLSAAAFELKWICSEDADLQVFVSHAARWLRVACPDECGCTDPLATPLLKPPFHGCREACIQEAYGFSFQSTSPLYGNVPNFTLGCKDAPPGPGWRHFWDHYLAYISYETNFDYSTIQSLVDWVAYARDAGCVALQWLPLDMQGNMWCRGGEKYRSLAWFCPETCGCAAFGRLPKLAKLELYLHNCKLGAEGGRRAGLHFGSSASNKLEKLGVFGLDLWLTAMQAAGWVNLAAQEFLCPPTWCAWFCGLLTLCAMTFDQQVSVTLEGWTKKSRAEVEHEGDGSMQIHVISQEPKAGLKKVEAGAEKDLQEELICFDRKSAWSIPLVISWSNFSESVFACALLIVNIAMQSLFTLIIASPEFLGTDFSDNLETARVWRSSAAHDVQFVDLSGKSLATRVCDEDGSLIYSTAQAALVSSINSYLGLGKLGPEGFSVTSFQPGVLLAVLCILLWIICIVRELRNVWYVLQAVLFGGTAQVGQGGEGVQVSGRRAAAMSLVCLGRAT
ncbi:Uncharacterized protein SCF082_LOCUS15102, partial [Durusdinium trenchii]